MGFQWAADGLRAAAWSGSDGSGDERSGEGTAGQIVEALCNAMNCYDGKDVVVFTVDALDSAGRALPAADNTIDFKITGEGALIGVGNGDPNCHESDKEPRRSLFNGLVQAIVQSTQTPGTITIEASTVVSGSAVAPAKVEVTTKQVELRASVT